MRASRARYEDVLLGRGGDIGPPADRRNESASNLDTDHAEVRSGGSEDQKQSMIECEGCATDQYQGDTPMTKSIF